jgi:hypothetical protein
MNFYIYKINKTVIFFFLLSPMYLNCDVQAVDFSAQRSDLFPQKMTVDGADYYLYSSVDNSTKCYAASENANLNKVPHFTLGRHNNDIVYFHYSDYEKEIRYDYTYDTATGTIVGSDKKSKLAKKFIKTLLSHKGFQVTLQ